MNRPHVAALLREIAFEAEVTARLVGGENNPPEIEAEIDALISEMAERLRLRAGEIEASGRMSDRFPFFSHRSMAEVLKEEQNLPDLRVVGDAFLALSQSPESSRRRKDDPLARRESGSPE